MRHGLRVSSLVLLCALSAASCLHAQPADPEEVAGLAAALTKVSAPLHSAVRYKTPAPGLKDQALLDFATAHNPALLERFRGYVLKARQENGNSSVLVCDAQGAAALAEDAGCTGAADWKAETLETPCAYVLDLKATCPAR